MWPLGSNYNSCCGRLPGHCVRLIEHKVMGKLKDQDQRNYEILRIKGFLQQVLPYYECDDKDQYFYHVEPNELYQVAEQLRELLWATR